ncbi:hypothetical protein BCR33DRAFT_787028 [Rhizoclosmatium globosum]|uniref:Uncharacterized protein n=1 Tax=Rhizoclosmatium globosum TaxID=329046 RepID=A0A1Y2C2L6_9FUNG|nr:hypothetical protein BCR33DRAFT_787028 [Rhizoclosmatium globosum]|eukprot:ORY41282.1 hypothetical protein BCR33DRAFT_787028 [Rhizoclosmatium globosum]
MDSRSKSPPLFSDNEDETPSPSKRLRPDQIQDGDSDSDDPMAGFMDGYEDLSPDEIEVKDTEYALVLGFIEGSVALDERLGREAEAEADADDSAADSETAADSAAATTLAIRTPVDSTQRNGLRRQRGLVHSRSGINGREYRCRRRLAVRESGTGSESCSFIFLALRTVPTLQKTLSDEELNMQYIRQLQKEEQEQERLRKQRVLEDEAIARKIQQQVEKEEHDKLLAQMKASKSSSLPSLPSNSQGSSSSAYSSQAIKRDPPSFVKPEPFNGVDLTNDDDSDPYQPFYDRKAASSFSASSSSSQQPSKFVPPPPVIKYGSQYNSFTEKPIYDMATLLPGGSNYNPNIKPEYDPNEGHGKHHSKKEKSLNSSKTFSKMSRLRKTCLLLKTASKA